MSARFIPAMRQMVWTVFASLGFIGLLALMVVSVAEIYTVVIAGLLSSAGMEKALLAGVLLAALIPFGYMVVHVYVLGRVMAKNLGGFVYRLFG